MIEYSHAGKVTYAWFAGETDNLRYNWFKSLHREFKRSFPSWKTLLYLNLS